MNYLNELSEGVLEIMTVLSALCNDDAVSEAQQQLEILNNGSKKILAQYYHKFVAKPFYAAIRMRDKSIFTETFITNKIDVDNIQMIGIFRKYWETFSAEHQLYIWKKLAALNAVSFKLNIRQ